MLPSCRYTLRTSLGACLAMCCTLPSSAPTVGRYLYVCGIYACSDGPSTGVQPEILPHHPMPFQIINLSSSPLTYRHAAYIRRHTLHSIGFYSAHCAAHGLQSACPIGRPSSNGSARFVSTMRSRGLVRTLHAFRVLICTVRGSADGVPRLLVGP
ncbi:hypothetical protein F5Y08DRAFT_92547 [Xylaria arbuscula]|nr:hypothetical protein F5Y08DRAFT_92547 [Xylaria arbuscula]